MPIIIPPGLEVSYVYSTVSTNKKLKKSIPLERTLRLHKLLWTKVRKTQKSIFELTAGGDERQAEMIITPSSMQAKVQTIIIIHLKWIWQATRDDHAANLNALQSPTFLKIYNYENYNFKTSLDIDND